LSLADVEQFTHYRRYVPPHDGSQETIRFVVLYVL
jgi:hypothetical protein